VDALKDAVAAIRCAVAEDAEGLRAIVYGTAYPHHLAATIAGVAAVICIKGGLDNARITALVGEIASQLTDFVLDQARPGSGPGAAS